jgi:hypothetical protein
MYSGPKSCHSRLFSWAGMNPTTRIPFFVTLLIISIIPVESRISALHAVLIVSLSGFRAEMAHALPTDCQSTNIVISASGSNTVQSPALPAIRTCKDNSECCEQTECISNICVALNNVTTTFLKAVSRTPNANYVIFSLWDDKCNPYSVTSNFLDSKFYIQEFKSDFNSFQPISQDEGWHGLSDSVVPTVARALLLMDVSDSVRKNQGIAAIKAAVGAFLDSLTKTKKTSIEVAMYVFGGAITQDDPLFTIGTSTLQSSNFSSDYIRFQEMINASNFDCKSIKGEKLDCASTDLYGAVVSGLKKFIPDRTRITYDFLIVFSDGTDQAGLTKISSVESSLQKAPVTVYGVTIPGEGNDLRIWNRIATGGVFSSKDLSSIQTKFQEIATVIGALSRTIYVITYCTPSRSSNPVDVKAFFKLSVSAPPATIEFKATGTLKKADGAAYCDETNAKTLLDGEDFGNTLLASSTSKQNCFNLRRGNANPDLANAARTPAPSPSAASTRNPLSLLFPLLLCSFTVGSTPCLRNLEVY